MRRELLALPFPTLVPHQRWQAAAQSKAEPTSTVVVERDLTTTNLRRIDSSQHGPTAYPLVITFSPDEIQIESLLVLLKILNAGDACSAVSFDEHSQTPVAF